MWVAAIAMIAGSIMKTVGEVQSARAQGKLFGLESTSAKQAGAAAAARESDIERHRLGELHATIGASGIQMAGSPSAVYLDSVKNAALNVQDKLYEGRIKAWQAKVQQGFAGRQASAALWTGLMGTVATGAKAYGSGMFDNMFGGGTESLSGGSFQSQSGLGSTLLSRG